MVESELRNGTVRFVNDLCPYFKKGQTFNDFKISVIGKNNLKSITNEGDALLYHTYKLLNQNGSESVMFKSDITPMAYVILKSYENNAKDLQKGFEEIFGGDSESFNAELVVDKRICKWWRIDCHFMSLVNFLADNPEVVIALIIALL